MFNVNHEYKKKQFLFLFLCSLPLSVVFVGELKKMSTKLEDTQPEGWHLYSNLIKRIAMVVFCVCWFFAHAKVVNLSVDKNHTAFLFDPLCEDPIVGKEVLRLIPCPKFFSVTDTWHTDVATVDVAKGCEYQYVGPSAEAYQQMNDIFWYGPLAISLTVFFSLYITVVLFSYLRCCDVPATPATTTSPRTGRKAYNCWNDSRKINMELLIVLTLASGVGLVYFGYHNAAVITRCLPPISLANPYGDAVSRSLLPIVAGCNGDFDNNVTVAYLKGAVDNGRCANLDYTEEDGVLGPGKFTAHMSVISSKVTQATVGKLDTHLVELAIAGSCFLGLAILVVLVEGFVWLNNKCWQQYARSIILHNQQIMKELAKKEPWRNLSSNPAEPLLYTQP